MILLLPIPGYKKLTGKDDHELPFSDNIIFLLIGPSRSGKTTYCKTKPP